MTCHSGLTQNLPAASWTVLLDSWNLRCIPWARRRPGWNFSKPVCFRVPELQLGRAGLHQDSAYSNTVYCEPSAQVSSGTETVWTDRMTHCPGPVLRSCYASRFYQSKPVPHTTSHKEDVRTDRPTGTSQLSQGTQLPGLLAEHSAVPRRQEQINIRENPGFLATPS